MRTHAALGLATTAGLALTALVRVARRRRSISFAGRTVVIVGGSRGLGLVMARQFADEGARIALVARDPGTLAAAVDELKLRTPEVRAYSCDITHGEDVEAVVDEIVLTYGGIDVLINVAGIIDVGPFEHMTEADFERALSTHLKGPLRTIQAALPYMRRAGARRIVNISSIGGQVAVPHLLPYTVSKFALTGLSEGLRAELGKDGFAVTTVWPGLMRTGSTYNARFKGQHEREFAWFHLAGSMPGLSISAERAARRILDACRHGDATLTLTLPARLAALTHALCPRLTASLTGVANRMLPGATGSRGEISLSGWQSVSRFVPSPATTLADRATIRNNEIPQDVD
jgi:NAD(P)-dependent dehydrogenase (short-subunit alcohol dehydrogenase family)